MLKWITWHYWKLSNATITAEGWERGLQKPFSSRLHRQQRVCGRKCISDCALMDKDVKATAARTKHLTPAALSERLIKDCKTCTYENVASSCFFYVYVVVNSSLKMLFSHIGCVNGDVYLCSGFWNEKNVGLVVWFQFEGMFGLPSGSHYCPALFYIYKCVHFREGFQNVKIFSTKMLWVWTKG